MVPLPLQAHLRVPTTLMGNCNYHQMGIIKIKENCHLSFPLVLSHCLMIGVMSIKGIGENFSHILVSYKCIELAVCCVTFNSCTSFPLLMYFILNIVVIKFILFKCDRFWCYVWTMDCNVSGGIFWLLAWFFWFFFYKPCGK